MVTIVGANTTDTGGSIDSMALGEAHKTQNVRPVLYPKVRGVAAELALELWYVEARQRRGLRPLQSESKSSVVSMMPCI